ncbi:nucleotidyltransferase family protein [Amaricoccus solimangrovi]|uniref:Nucleotidyltransferase family protein n=1 Tax=Amaricoccus solimangrovi TaxID=2589815 RepID=A0A501WYS7_9RHOB|nr:nucleotidyltransferase family protein [Amaricoccus solimangrovi]TPE52737.1 nucleotidyltransferase family protein [Amaricoccus solimangrovi]
MRPRAAMIFAAGLGTRMGELTRHRPKPLIEVAGRPLLARALDLTRAAGVARTVVNIHAHPDQMRAWLAAEAPEAVVSEEPALLETGGGLRAALPLLGHGPVFTLNADMVWRGPNPLDSLARAWDPARMDALLCLVPRERAAGHTGVGDFFRDAEGRLTRRGAAPEAPFVYAGTQIIEPARLGEIPERIFSLNRLWDLLLAGGRVFGAVHDGGWVDVGRPEGIARAEAELAR